MKDTPAFATWTNENLSRIATDLYQQNVELREEIEAVRLDNKQLLNTIRDIWKEQDVRVR